MTRSARYGYSSMAMQSGRTAIAPRCRSNTTSSATRKYPERSTAVPHKLNLLGFVSADEGRRNQPGIVRGDRGVYVQARLAPPRRSQRPHRHIRDGKAEK